MKAPIFKFSVLLAGILVSAGMSFGQEYDDMYFTKKDRKALNEKSMSINKNLPSAQTEEATEYVKKNENAYSEEHVNPEYLARYGNNTTDKGQATGEYYSESQNDDYQAPVVNNYYVNNGPGFANNLGFYDPWMWNPYYGSRWRFNLAFGFGSGWGWGPSFGWGTGFGWGNPWGWGYDPFFGPSWNVGMSWGWGGSWGWGSPWGWNNPWMRPGWGWGGGFYGGGYWGYPGNVVVINNYENRYNRTFRRGAGPSRQYVARERRDGSYNNSGDRFTDRTGETYGRAGNTSRVASSTASRRYIDPNNSATSRSRVTQADYHRRSQASSRAVSNDAYSRSRTSAVSRSAAYSSPRSNYSTRTRATGSSYGTTNSRTSSGYSRSVPGYRSPTNSTRSYSPNATRTRSSSSYQRSSSPSRSSGSYQRSSSPSRSSSGYRSSGGSSRSSGVSRGSSGASRSSGSSRSSSGGRRGGN